MERIQTREKSLNSQYKARVAEYHEIQEKLTEVSKRYDESNEAVLEQQNALTAITDELETIRSQSTPPPPSHLTHNLTKGHSIYHLTGSFFSPRCHALTGAKVYFFPPLS